MSIDEESEPDDCVCPLGAGRELPHLCHGDCHECIIALQEESGIGEDLLDKKDIDMLRKRHVRFQNR